jgi:hypothetical protein
MADTGESEKDRFNRFRDSFAKEISERQKVMTSLTTMSSALIALPLLFFKDIFRETIKAGETILMLIERQHPIVSGMAYTSYVMLIACVFMTLIYTMKAGQFLHNLYKFDYPPEYLDKNGGETDRNTLNRIFDWAVYAFMLGFWLMIAFVITYAKTSPDLPAK